MWWLSKINLNAGYWDIFWPQFVQGTSLGFLFVPLTTITHDPIPKEQMGNATSLFNLMRNIGGSIGIAAVTTIVARQTQANINVLGKNASQYDPAARMMFQGARSMFMSKGMDYTTATQQAYGAIFGMVQQQASILAFLHSFRLLAFMFLAVMPLILLMKPPRHKGGPGASMH
jgi:DHA2 family multidrug resistance protein